MGKHTVEYFSFSSNRQEEDSGSFLKRSQILFWVLGFVKTVNFLQGTVERKFDTTMTMADSIIVG